MNQLVLAAEWGVARAEGPSVLFLLLPSPIPALLLTAPSDTAPSPGSGAELGQLWSSNDRKSPGIPPYPYTDYLKRYL